MIDRHLDIRDLGEPHLSYRRLWNIIDRLPRESATVQARYGDAVRWSDDTNLLAMAVDLLGHIDWATVQAPHFKGAPKRPPKPLVRPGETATVGETAQKNLTEKTTFTAGSLSLDEMDRVIEEQTGRRPMLRAV